MNATANAAQATDPLARAVQVEAADVARAAQDLADAAATDGPTMHQRAEALLLLAEVRERLEIMADRLNATADILPEDSA